MSYIFDLVDFSKYDEDQTNNRKDKEDLTNCFEVELDEKNDDETYYNNLYFCKEIIGNNMDKIVEEFPQVKDGLDPKKNSLTKSLIDDGLSVKEAYAMGFLLMLAMISSLSKN